MTSNYIKFIKYLLLCSIVFLSLYGCSSRIEYESVSKNILSPITDVFFIQTRKNGADFEPQNESIKVGEDLDLYFVDNEGSLNNEMLGATWRSQGAVGTLNIGLDGISAKFTAVKKGEAKIFAEHNGRVKFVTITITNSSPLLDSINDQMNIGLGNSIAQINSGDNGLDQDIDGDSLSYSCFYDTNVDGVVSNSNSCNSLSGLNFSASSGVLDWLTQAGQVNLYEFKIIASDGVLEDDEIFTIDVVSNASPVIDSISNQSGVVEGSAIAQIDTSDGGDDLDADGQVLNYECYYDMTIDSTVSSINLCSSISGLTFNSSTGILNWTTSLGQAGDYELKIIASDGTNTGDEIFTLQIQSDDAPLIDAIADNRIAKENIAITIDVGDGGDDFDGNGDALTYSCVYDTTIDDSVSGGTNCSGLSGVTFNNTSGLFNWTPTSSQYGKYEFKIVASDGTQTDDEVFVIGVLDPIDFTMVWRTTVANDSIELPLRAGFNYNFTVDWGDGTTGVVTGASDSDKNHIFASPGDYVVTLSGLAEAFHLANSGNDRFKLIAIPYLGDMDWTNLQGAFYGAENLESFAGGVTTNVTTMSEMFRNANSLVSIDLSTFDTSNVTNMVLMFYGCGSLTTLDLSSFNTSNVTSFSSMFASTGIANLDISSFDTSSAVSFYAMFTGVKVTDLDLSHFNTSNVTDFRQMFRNMRNLVNLDISSFDTSNATTMQSMFSGVSSLTSLDLSHFDTTNVTSMMSMFGGTTSLISLDISNFNTSNVTNMSSMFMQMRNIPTLDVSSFDTSSVTDMWQMFRDLNVVTTLDLSNFNTSNVTNMTNLFLNMNSLTSLDISNFNTSNVLTMNSMFNGVSSLTTLDVSHFDTSSTISLNSMFKNMSSLTSLNVSGFTNTQVTSMDETFRGLSSLSSLNLSTFNTSSATSMRYIFAESAMQNLDLTNFSTLNVTDMEGMFSGMNNLVSLDLSSFNTQNVQDMSYMFDDVSSLTTLDISHFRADSLLEAHSMFREMSSLSSFNFSGFSPSLVQNMNQMFYGLDALNTILIIY